MQGGVSHGIMDISEQSSGTDHIRTSSAEVCQVLQTFAQHLCICSQHPKDPVEKLLRVIFVWSNKNLLLRAQPSQCTNPLAVPLGKCRHCTWKWFSSIWEQQGLSPALSLFFWREGKVASYVTKHHFTAVGRVMYEDRNGQCWNSRPHTRTQTHTQTQDWWMTRVLGPELRLVAWWLIKDFKRWRPAAATISS